MVKGDLGGGSDFMLLVNPKLSPQSVPAVSVTGDWKDLVSV